MMVRGTVLLALAAVLAIAGCGAFGDGGDRRIGVPAALPADVPLPEGAVLRVAQDRGGKGINLVYETGRPAAAVSAGLRSRLEAGGWSLLSELSLEESAFASYRKEGRSVALGVSTRGGITVVAMDYNEPGRVSRGEPG